MEAAHADSAHQGSHKAKTKGRKGARQGYNRGTGGAHEVPRTVTSHQIATVITTSRALSAQQ